MANEEGAYARMTMSGALQRINLIISRREEVNLTPFIPPGVAVRSLLREGWRVQTQAELRDRSLATADRLELTKLDEPAPLFLPLQ